MFITNNRLDQKQMNHNRHNAEKEVNGLKKGYQDTLWYVVYNGPPNTICNDYHGDVKTERGLIQGVKLCSRLYNYVINPSEQVTVAHIEHHGIYDISKDLLITKNIARAMIIYDHNQLKNYRDMFTDDDLIDMLELNPNILRYVKKQTYEMCCNVIKNIIHKSQSALHRDLFHGGSGIWHENINASFVECFNLDCFDSKDEIIKLYELMFENNNNSIRYMVPRYISLNMLSKYIQRNPEFLKEYIDKFPDNTLSTKELESMYCKMVDTMVYNFRYVDPKYQNQQMIDKIINDNHGVAMYQYIYNIEEIGKKLYTEAFEKNHNNIAHLPNKYKTMDICDRAVKYNNRNIKYVPAEFQTLEMCRMVGMNDYQLIKYCNHIDLEMLQSVHKQCAKKARKERYDFINEFDDDKIITVLKIMPRLLLKIKHDRLTDQMIRVALERNGYILEYVIERIIQPLLIKDYIDIALKNQPEAKKYIMIKLDHHIDRSSSTDSQAQVDDISHTL